MSPDASHDVASRRNSRAAVLAAFCVALLLGLGAFLLVRPRYALVDDYVQQLYVSGRLLGSGPCRLMPYTLSLLSVPMSLLYQALPAVPWYVLTLLALIVVSFWACGVVALRSRLGSRAAACACIVLTALETCSVLYLTYTVVAFLAASAGLALLVTRAAFGRSGVRASDVGGLALVVLGFALRPESGLGSFVVFSPFAVYVLAKNRHALAILRGLAAIALVGVVAVAGKASYDLTPGWENYNDYLSYGRSSLDYPELSADELRSIDPSVTDATASVLNKWIFIQSEPFDIGFFKRIASERPHVSLAYLVSALKAKTTWLAFGLVVILGAVGAALMRSMRAARATRALLLGICAMALAGCLVFALRARVRLHVVLPLAISTFMAIITCCHAPARPQGTHLAAQPKRQAGASPVTRWALPALVLLACMAVTTGFWYKAVRPLTVLGTSSLAQEYDAYLRESDGIVIQGAAQTAFVAHDALSFEQGEYPQNALVPGGWMIYTAPWTDWLAKQGLTNADTLEQLAKRSDMTLVTTEQTAETIRTFIEERIGSAVEKSAVRTLGDDQQLYVWRYKLA